jgi:carboxylesterase
MTITYDVPDYTKGYYRDRAPVRRCARPWAMLHSDKPPKAALLIHGYAGYPGELIRPGVDLFDAGWDVHCPRLSGHGTSGRDFSKSKAKDWIGCTRNAYMDLAQRYDEVAVVGHSMGGALAVIVASLFSVDTLALIAPALLIPSIPVKTIRFMRFFVKRQRTEWKSDPEYRFHYEGDADDDAYLGSQYWSYYYLRQIWQLERVRQMAVGCIEDLKSDTLSVIGSEDGVIGEPASLLATSKPLGSNKHLLISGGGHYLPYDKDRTAQDRAMEAVVAWLGGQRQ